MPCIPSCWAVFGLSLIHALATAFASTVSAHESLLQKVVTTIFVVEYPMYINTHVLQNTSFAVNDDISITVENAPTHLVHGTIGASRKTIINTVPADHPRSSKIFARIPFNLRVSSIGSNLNERQVESSRAFVGIQGLAVNCSNVPVSYSIVNGQLLATSNGTSGLFSAPAGAGYAPFVPSSSPSPGDLTTTFSIDQVGTLLWTNPAFANGNALFCILQSGQIMAVFQLNAQPQGCIFINLDVTRFSHGLSSCASSTDTIVLGPLSGPTGIQGIPGPSGVQGQPGSVGPQGSQGIPGPSGAQGQPGSVGPQGSQGIPGPSGVQGQPGSVGPQGSQGIPGPSGVQGQPGSVGPQGSQGIPGPSGVQGQPGSVGPQGSQGIPGPSGAQGIPGPTGATGIAYSYLGCFYQTGVSTLLSGKVLSNYQATYASNINQLCSTACNSLNYNFFGTVNSGASPTSGDCYCGNALNFVSVAPGVGNGMAPDNNCGTCNSGPGQCGILTSSTIAIYARAF